MEPAAFHLVMRLKNDRVIAPTLGERRILARTMLEQGRQCQLLGFGLPDNHLHSELVEAEARAREFARCVAIALTKRLRLPGGFSPAHLEPIRSTRHLQNALRYVIGQSAHHGAMGDPDFEGTNLPDLLGLRPLGGFTADVVRRWLPRLRDDEILSWAGASTLTPVDGPPEALRQAAQAALGRSSLDGSDRLLLRVRRAVLHLAEPALADAEIGCLLGVSARTIRRLRRQALDKGWVLVLGRQLAWLSRPGRAVVPAGPFVAASGQRLEASRGLANGG